MGKDRSVQVEQDEHGFAITRAFRSMQKTQQETNKAFGELLGEAVKRSIDTLLLILGFIVLFSVIFEILTIVQVTDYLSIFISKILPETILPKSLHESIVSGLFEITIATSLASQANAPLIPKVAVCSAIIAWSGLSVHAQVAAVIQPSRLSIWPYSVARLFQSILAALYTIVLMKFNEHRWALPTFEPTYDSVTWIHSLGISTKTCLIWVSSIVCLSLLVFLAQTLKHNLRKQ